MTPEIETLRKWVEESGSIVFFGGAGVSTESGIPDFRGTGGLYHQQYAYPPETILSHTFFERNPEEFFRFYRDKMLFLDPHPTPAHRKRGGGGEQGTPQAVTPQNTAAPHQKAGSRRVLELHGSVLRNHCQTCGTFYGVEAITDSIGVPRCRCGGIIKPDVVLYEEGLDEEVLMAAVSAIRHAEVLIIGGTSLTVYPAAGLVRYYRGNKLVVINKTELPGTEAGLTICGPIGQVMSQL